MKELTFSALKSSDVEAYSILSTRQYWRDRTGYSFSAQQPRETNGFLLVLCKCVHYSFDNEERLDAPKNALICMPTGSTYRIEFEVDEPNQPASVLVNFELKNSYGENIKLEDKVKILCTDAGERIVHLFLKLADDYRTGNFLKTRRNFYTLLTDISSLLGKDELEISEINDMTEYIKSSIGDGLKISDIARRFAMSEVTFRRKFKEYLGISPVEYINRVKTERAKELIGRDDITTDDICTELNFYDPSHFYKVFRKYAGTTPERWRKREAVDTNFKTL